MKNLFKGPQLELASPRPEDFDEMVDWQLDSDYLRNLDTAVAYPQTANELEQTVNNRDQHTEYYFHIRLSESDLLLGFATLYNVEWQNQTAQLAIAIGDPDERGKGYGTEALTLLLNYAFHELNLFKVNLEVISYNEHAIAVYQNTGFEFEGTNKAAVLRDGQRYDVYSMGLFATDFRSRL